MLTKNDLHFIKISDTIYLLHLVTAMELIEIDVKTKTVLTEKYLNLKTNQEIAAELNIDIGLINQLEVSVNSLLNNANNVFAEQKKGKATKELKINVAHACNLKCGYCYAAYNKDRSIMQPETAHKVVDMLKANNNTYYHITFFGGEPMLNLPVIKLICEELGNSDLNENVFSYGMVTNGTVINDEAIKLFTEFNFHIRVSLDGEEKIQNILRPYKNGSHTYSTIHDNCLYLIENKIPISFEVTYTKQHQEMNISCNDVVTYLKNTFGENISILIVDAQGDENYMPDKKSMNLEKFYLYDEEFRYRILFFAHKMRFRYTCGAGMNTIAIAANGDIYPCQKFIDNNSNLKIGNVSNFVFNYTNAPNKDFEWHDHNSNPKCINCVAKHLCKDCTAAFYEKTGTLIYNDEQCGMIITTAEMFLTDVYKLRKNQKEYEYVLSQAYGERNPYNL